MKKIMLAFVIISFCACNESKPVETKTEMPIEQAKYTPEMVVNKNDYACGMPVTAGINDTSHIDGKAYGFCSSECKNEFLKDPNKYLSQK